MERIIKFCDIEIPKQKFCQYRRPISIKNIDINKIVVSLKVSLVKRDLNILMTTKMLKNYTFMYISPKKDCM